ncbi:MAG TPA: hypothetical protein VGE39_17715 [Prosthecobacter sp.]
MTKDRSDIIRTTGHWLELKRAWGTWKEGQPMPALSIEAQLYFENLGLRTMNDALEELGSAYENVPRLRDGREAWSQIFTYLVAQRPRSSARLLDDIFVRARSRADLPPGLDERTELEQIIGWVLKQFSMRVRDGARVYAREHGTAAQISRTSSANKALGNDQSDPSQTTVMDVLQYVDAEEEWGTELERREMQELGERLVQAQFPDIASPAKLSLYLRALRRQRDVIISVDNATVLAVANLRTAQFAQKAVDALQKLARTVAEQPACLELDGTGKYYYSLCATLSLLDRTELWTHLGQCVTELIEAHATAGPAKRIPPAEMVPRMEAFADMLLQRLQQTQSLFSENELAPLFNALAAARLKHCQ